MKRLFVSIALIVFVGCSATRTAKHDYFRRDADARFDLTAVRSFLSQLISKHPVVDGVAIENTRIGDSWAFDRSWAPVGLTSGDWTFQQDSLDKSEFQLSYRADEQSAVVFRCKSVHRGQFELVAFSKEELVILTDCSIVVEK